MGRIARSLLLPLLLLALTACGAMVEDVAGTDRSGDTVPGQYLVVLADDGIQRLDRDQIGTTVERLSADLGVRASATLPIARAFVASDVGPADLRRLESDPRVALVEPDQVVRVGGEAASWGLDRID